MARTLLVMRHAKSAWDTGAPGDFERPLAKRGERDAPRMGTWMAEEKLAPDHVVSSPAERAKQTALAVCKILDVKKKRIVWDSRIYGAGTEDLLEVLAEVPKKAETVLIVGHNPGLEFLTAYLTGGLSGPELGVVKTATVVNLEMPDDWSQLAQGCAKMIHLQNPRDLPQ